MTKEVLLTQGQDMWTAYFNLLNWFFVVALQRNMQLWSKKIEEKKSLDVEIWCLRTPSILKWNICILWQFVQLFRFLGSKAKLLIAEFLITRNGPPLSCSEYDGDDEQLQSASYKRSFDFDLDFSFLSSEYCKPLH